MGRLATTAGFLYFFSPFYFCQWKYQKTGEFFKKIQMFEFHSQSLKFIVGTFLILNSSLWSLMRFSAFLGFRCADNAITWSFTVFWHPYSLFFFCPSLLCFLNLASLMTPLRAGTVWCANNKWQLSCHWGQQNRQWVLLQPEVSLEQQ